MTASDHAQQRSQRFPLPGRGRPQMDSGLSGLMSQRRGSAESSHLISPRTASSQGRHHPRLLDLITGRTRALVRHAKKSSAACSTSPPQNEAFTALLNRARRRCVRGGQDDRARLRPVCRAAHPSRATSSPIRSAAAAERCLPSPLPPGAGLNRPCCLSWKGTKTMVERALGLIGSPALDRGTLRRWPSGSGSGRATDPGSSPSIFCAIAAARANRLLHRACCLSDDT